MIGINWLTETTTDFEYKKYSFLAYFMKIKQQFSQNKLYPFYTELLEGYNEIQDFIAEKRNINTSFPKEIKRLNILENTIEYQPLVTPTVLKPIDKIVEFIMPLFDELLTYAVELEHKVKTNTTLEAVGVLPIYQKEGFVFINVAEKRTIDVYAFNQKYVITGEQDQLEVNYITTENMLRSSLIGLKKRVIKQFKLLPNPATYFVQSMDEYPMEETLLPETKQKIYYQINKKGS